MLSYHRQSTSPISDPRAPRQGCKLNSLSPVMRFSLLAWAEYVEGASGSLVCSAMEILDKSFWVSVLRSLRNTNPFHFLWGPSRPGRKINGEAKQILSALLKSTSRYPLDTTTLQSSASIILYFLYPQAVTCRMTATPFKFYNLGGKKEKKN